jgi:hypothetical protein
LGVIVSFINELLDSRENTWVNIQNFAKYIRLGTDLSDNTTEALTARMEVEAAPYAVSHYTQLSQFDTGDYIVREYLVADNGVDISVNAELQTDYSWHSDDNASASFLISLRNATLGCFFAPASAGDLDFATYAETTLLGTTLTKAITNGQISFYGINDNINPDPANVVRNTLYGKNIAKVWGSVVGDGAGGVTLSDGFNIESVSVASSDIVITFKRAMADINYEVSPAPFDSAGDGVLYTVKTVAKNTAYCKLRLFAGGGAPFTYAAGIPGPALHVDFSIFGAQAP